MPPSLTKRQQQVLELIQAQLENTGYPPTRAEIAGILGFRSANAAEDHLRALARKGVIELIAGASRGIRLVHGASSGAAPFTLPIVGRVAAGSPILASEHLEGEVGVQPSLFSRQPDYLLRVHGSSMRDAGILDGDLLAVQKTQVARHGQIIVARLEDEVTVKRFSNQGGQLRLLPENPDFSPIVLGPDDGFAVEGLAVGLIRNQPL